MADRHAPAFDGDKLRELRLDRGLSMRQLGVLAARYRRNRKPVDHSNIGAYERGETRPHPDTARALALALGHHPRKLRKAA